MRKLLSGIVAATLTLGSFAAAVAYPQMERLSAVPSEALARAVPGEPTQTSRIKMLPARGDNGIAAPFMKELTSATSLADVNAPRREASSTELPMLYGMVIYNDASTVGYSKIIEGKTENLFYATGGKEGSVVHDNLLYNQYTRKMGPYESYYVSAYDIASGEETSSFGSSRYNSFFAAAEDPVSGTVYVICYDDYETGLSLGTLTFDEYGISVSRIADLEGAGDGCNALACDANGQLYAIFYEFLGNESGQITDQFTYLATVDKTNGEVTMIGDTGKDPLYRSSACIDPTTGRMFWNVCDASETGVLCEVDLATGVATDLFQFEQNDEIAFMYVVVPEAEANAPAAAENLAAEFPNGSLTGTVSFDCPATLFDGTPATGSVNYTITLNNAEVKTGTAAYGQHVDAEVTASASGTTVVAVVVSNENGPSPKVNVSLFVGYGIPAAPAPMLEYAGGNFTVTWQPVASTTDGGYIDPENVVYDVVRYPGEEKVGREIRECSFTEAIAMPAELTKYYYEVTAHSAEITSVAGKTSGIVLGSTEPPYSNDFSAYGQAINDWTILNVNGDNRTWESTGGKLRYAYSTNYDADDWALMPPMRLEGGKAYRLTFNANNQNRSNVERLEVKYGAAPNPAALTNEVVPPTEIDGNGASDLHEFVQFITPEETGVYYIGFHAISDKDKYYLFVDDVVLSEGSAVNGPAAVENLTVSALAPVQGEPLKAQLEFTAPSATFTEIPLSEIAKIEIKRNDELVKVLENVAPGSAQTVVDEIPRSGQYTWTVTAYNTESAGAPATVSAYVGYQKPVPPTGVNMVETSEGIVKITWAPVTEDVEGQTYVNGGVTYIIAYQSSEGWMPMITDIAGTEAEGRAVAEGAQAFVQFAVFANYEGMLGNGTPTPVIPVGTPYAGLTCSFADGTAGGYSWATGYASNGEWGVYNDRIIGGVKSQDSDNGFIGMKGINVGSKASMISGKINLAEMQNPGVGYYTYNLMADNTPNENEVGIYAREPEATEWTLLSTKTVGTVADGGRWGYVSADLSAFAGKTVMIRIEAETKTYVYTFVDNIVVGDLKACDLAATAIEAPSQALAGSDFIVDVTIANVGTQDVAAASVTLYADGEAAASKTIEALAAGTSVPVSFDCTMSPLAAASVVYTAKVELAGDESAANDETGAAEVAPVASTLPAIENLTGEKTQSNAAKLEWTLPAIAEPAVRTLTETFEGYSSWAQEIDGWTFVDADGALQGGISGVTIPGITAGASTGSFFVWDTDVLVNEMLVAHSGSKYLASMYRYDDGKVDDWAVSPQLSGNAQTISFYAKSFYASYPEALAVYAGASTDIEQMKASTPLLVVDQVPGGWTLYELELPEGTTHFAINSCAVGGFMLMIDDITYEGVDGTAGLEVLGCDIYRDGLKINETIVAANEYVDATATPAVHTYNAIVRYNKGMSAPSNSVSVDLNDNSGIDDIASAPAIEVVDRTIVIRRAAGRQVTVSAVNGMTIFDAIADEETSIGVAPGVYIVKAAQTVVKVAVE